MEVDEAAYWVDFVHGHHEDFVGNIAQKAMSPFLVEISRFDPELLHDGFDIFLFFL